MPDCNESQTETAHTSSEGGVTYETFNTLVGLYEEQAPAEDVEMLLNLFRHIQHLRGHMQCIQILSRNPDFTITPKRIQHFSKHIDALEIIAQKEEKLRRFIREHLKLAHAVKMELQRMLAAQNEKSERSSS